MIRKADKEDIEAISQIYVDAWKSVYSGIMPEEVLICMTYEKQKKKWQGIMDQGKEEIYVYEAEQQVVGFASGFIENSECAEIATLYFAEEERGKGYGTELLEYMIHEFGKGREVRLWCVKDNPNRNFYRHQGGKIGLEKTVKIGEKEIQGIQFVFERH